MKPVVEEAVQRAVQELVQHYSQPIHHDDSMIDNDEAPYFDEVLGGQRIVPPVVQHWVDSLVQTRTGTGTGTGTGPGTGTGTVSASSAAAGVAKCYQLYVRPALLVSNSPQHPCKKTPVWKETTLPVLVHYELLLAQLILVEAAASAGDTTEERLNEKEEQANSNKDGDLMFMSVLALTRDIQCLVANVASKNMTGRMTKNIKGDDMVVVRNKLLPTLLRVLMHMIHLMPKRAASSSSQQHSMTMALTEATVTALTCMTMKHNHTPNENHHSNNDTTALVQLFCLSHMVQHCAYPPPPPTSSSLSFCSTGEAVPSRFLTSPVLPEQRLRLELISSQLPWMDAVSGISTRAAWGILRTIHSSIVMGDDDGGMSPLVPSPTTMHNHEEVLHGVLDFLGVEALAQCVRANFFGRSYTETDDNDQTDNNSNVQTLSEWDRSSAALVSNTETRGNVPKQMVKVGQPIPLAPLGDDRDDDSIPLHRVHVALVFLQVTIVNDEKVISSELVSHILPMLFTLMDSSNTSYTAFGAVGLYHVLRACTPTTIMEYYDSIATILKETCRTCRDGVALPLLATARAQLYCVLGMAHDGVRKDRRTATMELLSILKNQSYKQMEVEQCMMVGLLVGGIHPLLVRHAENESFITADSMEMARLGISALLSLLEWDYGLEGRRIQMAAMCALISLMMGAHPILPRHGGKIMTQLMTCIGRANQDDGKRNNQIQTREEHDACHACLNLALHTASVALILCGSRAEQVLTMIETTQKTYPPYLIQSCANIRQAASNLLQNENEQNGDNHDERT
eukprot:CAMPEP_0198286972 /NCGR_PEP_ID=MMETSP1449-20131203/5921_1 /TAXON_ID=420275 /ORGANISM="Attheya septentrionalis, Strain CCMP2084" /LENGTH=795 /DNA_ID=CAMNT_0043984841 /DNA_START=327 /DNA_END=2714 /DNA_ORIENTATION=+